MSLYIAEDMINKCTSQEKVLPFHGDKKQLKEKQKFLKQVVYSINIYYLTSICQELRLVLRIV